MALTAGVPAAGWDPRLSVHALSTRHWSLAQDLELYRRLGIHRISVSLPKLAGAGIDAVPVEFADRGLRVDGIYPGCAFDLTDPSSWGRVRDAMVTALEWGHRLGAHTLQTTGGRAGGHPFEWAVDRLAEALGPVAEAARRSGLGIALEPTTAHLWWEPGLAGLLAAGVSTYAMVQVADLDLSSPVLERVVPGDGDLALGARVGELLAAGYRGPFELELIGRAIEDEGYEASLLRSLRHLDGLLRAADGPPPA